jgi:hypothetical protein
MANKNPAANPAPAKVQTPTSTPLPRGADPAGQSKSSQKMSRPDPSQVAQRAYERYQQRGGQHGSDQDDWYQAERDLGGPGKPGGHSVG